MIIDAILDRKEGEFYIAKDFYHYANAEEIMFQMPYGIGKAMDYGTEENVQNALCEYIDGNEYNPEIKEYIRSVKWLENDDLHLFEDERRSK